MVVLEFLTLDNAPTEVAKTALPADIHTPSPDITEKTVVSFHETTFQVNENQATMWAPKGTKVIQPKSKGSGIMISDFTCEQSGYLSSTDDEYKRTKLSDPTIKKHARQWLKYGEVKGY